MFAPCPKMESSFVCFLLQYLHNDPVRQGPWLSSIFQMEQSQHREVKCFFRGHTAVLGKNLISNSYFPVRCSPSFISFPFPLDLSFRSPGMLVNCSPPASHAPCYVVERNCSRPFRRWPGHLAPSPKYSRETWPKRGHAPTSTNHPCDQGLIACEKKKSSEI